jgi:site-specific DNA recombinase
MEQNRSNKKMRTVLYLRVSSQEQVQNFSLANQEKFCREYCEKMGWEIAALFNEEGESAKSASRTQLLKLLDFCKENKGKIDVVLVYKFDRLARIAADHHMIKAQLIRYGISVKSVTEPVDNNSQGRLMENIYASFAQFDNDVRAERTKAGLKEKVSRQNKEKSRRGSRGCERTNERENTSRTHLFRSKRGGKDFCTKNRRTCSG